MDELYTDSFAKVNLTFDIVGIRAVDGYHFVKTIMVPVTLCDSIHLAKAARVTVTCEPDIAGPEHANLAFRAAMLVREASGYPGGAAVSIRKCIPAAAGLGGGSSNAAAVLLGLNELWGTGLDSAVLAKLAIQLGSDVPFFLHNQPALVEGVGERVKFIPIAQTFWLVLATPDVPKSTGAVYRQYDQLPQVGHPDAEAMARSLASSDIARTAGLLGNVFEAVMLPTHPEISAVKSAMLRWGALGALMSGAGPTVFGVVAREDDAQSLAKFISPLAARTFVVRVTGQANGGQEAHHGT